MVSGWGVPKGNGNRNWLSAVWAAPGVRDLAPATTRQFPRRLPPAASLSDGDTFYDRFGAFLPVGVACNAKGVDQWVRLILIR